MNLPNKITIARLVLTPIFAALLLIETPIAQLAAAAVFLMASVSDFIDGRIARSRNLITDFGKFMDPIADKLLVMVALVGLCAMGRVPAWATMLMLAREFIISGIRLVAASKGHIIAADKLGKIKTALQMVSLVMLILCTGSSYAVFYFLYWPAQVIFYLSVVMSMWSMIDYMARNREVFLHDM